MEDFSLDDYAALLDGFREAGYLFCGFDGLIRAPVADRPVVVVRHDIDISLNAALAIARLECEMGVHATYFVLMHSPFYNLFSAPSARALRQLDSWGHTVAMHVDVTRHANNYAKALHERHALHRVYPFLDTSIVSLHSPISLDPSAIHRFRCLNRVYGPVLDGRVQYIADSRGRQISQRVLQAAMRAGTTVELLTHPIWWVSEGATPFEKLQACLAADYEITQDNAREFLPKLFLTEPPHVDEPALAAVGQHSA